MKTAPKRIKVLHTLVRLGSGGVEQRRLSLANMLDPMLFEQRLVCTDQFGDLPDKFAKAGCAVHCVRAFHTILDPRPYWDTVKIIQQWRPHIIHGAVFEGVALAAVCGRLGQVPIILGEETSDPDSRSWKGHVLYRALTSMTHKVVAVSPAVQEYLVRRIHLPDDKVILVNNGVAERSEPSAEELREVRERLSLSSSDFVVGTVGRLQDSHKRVSDLIRAIAMLKGAIPNVKLLIVGGGESEQFLRELVRQQQLEDAVVFTGYQGDTRVFYGIMDVFALVSAAEAFGLVLVEAMYCGIPVVATRVGGIPGVVSDGETGILVEPFSPSDISAAISSLHADPGSAESMGARGRARAREMFSEERYVTDVAGMYRRLSGERGFI